MATVPAVLLWILPILLVALAVRIVVDVWLDVPYSVLLVLVGVAISALPVDVGIRLSQDVLMAIVLPIILFNGASELNRGVLRENAIVPLALIVLGVPLTVALLGAAGTVAFGLPLLVSLLFAVIVAPTDPVAVMSLFEEIEAPRRLTVIVEAESLFNDGVAVTIYAVVLSLLAEGSGTGIDRSLAWAAVGELVTVAVGGFLAGAAIGYGATALIRRVHERMVIVLVTVLAAYGSYVVAEIALGASGILATVGAGLFVATSDEAGGTDRFEPFTRDAWEAGSFLLSTLVYVLIGAQVPIGGLLDRLGVVILAAVIVLVVRAVVVHVLIGAANEVAAEPIPIGYQYVLVWGGLHTVVPVALALGLPGWVPHDEFIRTVVFGVAVFGALVQGSLLPYLLRIVGVRERPSWVGSAEDVR